MKAWTRWPGAAGALLGPWLDLAIRLAVAEAAVSAMMSGPAPAALMAAWPILLAIGLLARPAALVMLLFPTAGDAGLLWAALLVRMVVLGPGALSLDRLLHRGAESLAIPGAGLVQRAFLWGQRRIGPAYQFGLRVWLAAAPASMALAAYTLAGPMQPGLASWLPYPPATPTAAPAWLAAILAVLLVAGFGTRVAGLALLLLAPLSLAGPADTRLAWVLLLATIIVHGAGPWSVDAWLGHLIRHLVPRPGPDRLPHVVVVGGGFGGIAAVRGLRAAPCRVTLVDQRNYHLFQPLLYQVATASLSPGDIATPVRTMVRGQENVRVVLAEVLGVDPAAKTVMLPGGALPYDYLVLATGARHSYFGREDWASAAPGLKTLDDSTAIRRRLLLAFEEAEGAATEADRRDWLTFIVVGGGPTGVELAGAIAELARHGLTGEFRDSDPAKARVLLVQSGSRLLPTFPEALSRNAQSALEGLGVEVLLDSKVEDLDDAGVTIGGRTMGARTVLWAAGVMASPAAEWLGAEADKAGRVKVAADLSVPGAPGVFALGDTAASDAWAGKPVPGLAPAAKQGGTYVARMIIADLRHRPPPGPFRYRHAGSLATIGRQSAVADFGFVRLRGSLAWWLWGAAHITYLAGGRNRLTVLVEWLWAYLTFRRGTRLITGEGPATGRPKPSDVPAPA